MTPSMSKRGYPPPLLGWLVWGLGALFYLMGFFQRMAPAVITRELMSEFSLNAAALGNLSGYYFYAYVAMQIPTGVIADHWGPRRLLTAGAVVAGVGGVLFGLSPSLAWAEAGRLLVGGSVAVAWVALLKLSGHWFAPRRFALVSGISLLVGVIGAVSGEVPLSLLVARFGWRPVMTAAGVATLAIAAAAWLFIRNDPSEHGYQSFAIQTKQEQAAQGIWRGLGRIWRYRNTWLLFGAPGGMAGPVLTFAGLWGVPFLLARYGLEQSEAAAVCSLLMVSWALGGTLIGWLSDLIGRRKPLYLAGAVVGLAGWGGMIYWPGLPLWGFVALSVPTGLAHGAIVLSFAWGRESVPASLGGTLSGAINMGIMLGPTLLQPLVGWVLDQHWTGGMAQGARIYSVAAYQAGFTLMMAWAAATVVFSALAKETHCRQMA